MGSEMATNPEIDSIDPAEFSRCLFDKSADALFLFQPGDLSLVAANPAAQKLTRLTLRQLLKLSIAELVQPEHGESLQELLDCCADMRVFRSSEAYRLKCRQDDPVEVDIVVSPLNSDPNTLGMITVYDVTERRRIEANLRRTEALLQATLDEQVGHLEAATRELRESEEKYRTIVEATQEWIWEIDVTGIHTFSNPAIESILGYSADEVVGKSSLVFMHEEDRARVEKQLPEIMAAARGWQGWVIRWRHKDGSQRYLESNATPIFDIFGKHIGYRGADRDITQRIHAEESLRAREHELVHVSRLSTMGEMVAAIAHEVNQPLSAISNFADAAQRVLEDSDHSPDEPLFSWIQQIGQQAIRCGDIIRRLRHFVRRNDPQRRPVDISEIVRDSTKLLDGWLHRCGIALDIELPAQPPIALGDETELQQVLVNLVRNACDATVDAQVAQPQIRIQLSLGQDFVRVDVADNGPGIDDSTIARMFDPFFSTKPDGMGMGLAISRSIIENHRGRLWLDENRSSGTCFHMELPRSKPTEDVGAAAELPPFSSPLRPRIDKRIEGGRNR